MYKRLQITLLICLLPMLCFAEQQDPHQIIQETGEQVLNALQDDADAIRANPNRINELVDQIILPVCDLERMSKYILAKHWKTATHEQREKFTNEFKRMLIRTYGRHMADYSNAVFTVLPEKNTEKKYQTVNTELNLRNGSKPLQISYVFRVMDDSSKIVDVRVEGMSILKTFRTAFTYEIAETSLDELIERIANTNRPALALNTLN